jgi:excisionase family DNA binding protein
MIVLKTPDCEWLSTTEAANLLGVSPQYILRLIVKGRLTAQRASGKAWLVSRHSLESFCPTKPGRPRSRLRRK